MDSARLARIRSCAADVQRSFRVLAFERLSRTGRLNPARFGPISTRLRSVWSNLVQCWRNFGPIRPNTGNARRTRQMWGCVRRMWDELGCVFGPMTCQVLPVSPNTLSEHDGGGEGRARVLLVVPTQVGPASRHALNSSLRLASCARGGTAALGGPTCVMLQVVGEEEV